MPSINSHATPKKQEPDVAQHESLTEFRNQLNQYMAQMIDLMFQGQKENIRFMSEVQASLFRNGKSLTDAMSQHNLTNGYTASQSAAPNSLIQSIMDMNALMLNFAQSTAEQSANLAKMSLGNTHATSPIGKL